VSIQYQKVGLTALVSFSEAVNSQLIIYLILAKPRTNDCVLVESLDEVNELRMQIKFVDDLQLEFGLWASAGV
jgi:hypothetical protein